MSWPGWRAGWPTSATCRSAPRSGTATWSSCTRLGPGPADRSYGVQVAKLAGVPPAVVSRAREVLERLESQTSSPARLEDLPLFAPTAPAAVAEASAPSAIEEALAELDVDGMSPREALEALYRLKGQLPPPPR